MNKALRGATAGTLICLGVLCATLAASAEADDKAEKKSGEPINSLNNEFYLGLPFHFTTIRTNGGAASSRSFAGFDLLFRFCNSTWFCPHLSYTSSVDPNNGRRPLSGPSLGLHTFLLGSPDVAPRPGNWQAGSSDVFRVFLISDFAQREFDFRSKSSTNPLEDVVSATRVEGSMWAFSYGAGVEYSLAGWGRFGASVEQLKSQSTSVQDFSVSVTAFVLRYQIK